MNIRKDIKVKEENGKVVVEGVETEEEFYDLLIKYRKDIASEIIKDIKMLYG